MSLPQISRRTVAHVTSHRAHFLAFMLAAGASCSMQELAPNYNPPSLEAPFTATPLQPNPLLVPVPHPDFTWDAIVDVVDDYFRIAREERVRQVGDILVEGKIETLPAIGSTYLEPWRGDAASSYQKLEGTLQSVRRFAIVRVIPDARGYIVGVAVMKELEDVARPEFATAGAATFRHDGSLERYSSPGAISGTSIGWIPQGRDPALEQQILSQLHHRLVLDCELPVQH